MSVKKNNSNQNAPNDDSDLFRKAMAGVNRYPNNKHTQRHATHESAPKPPVNIRQLSPYDEINEAAVDSSVLVDQTDGELVEFARGGIQKNVLRSLKQGDYTIFDTLDLHGYTTAESERLLINFLRDSVNTGYSSVLIIHGKGLHNPEFGGVLKGFTIDWLKRQPVVNAFCSAQQHHGGTGAVYVLLKLRRNHE